MRKILSATLAVGVLTAGAANAGTASSGFQVTATVLATCSATATAVAFPNYTPGGGAVTANGVISVKCTNTSPYHVALNAGSNSGSAFTQRLMTLASGTATLQYNLYTTAAFATVFGDGSGTTSTMPGTGAGLATAVNTTVYGQLPDTTANQAVAPGSYSDTIAVTITY
jgi:spore coat protein U-like protein